MALFAYSICELGEQKKEEEEDKEEKLEKERENIRHTKKEPR